MLRQQSTSTNILLQEFLSFVAEASSLRPASFHGSATGGISTPFTSTKDKCSTAPFNRNTVPEPCKYTRAVVGTTLPSL